MAGGSASKNKGAGAERELGRIMEGAFGGKFLRSNNSGAFVGGKNAHRREGMSVNQVAGLKGDLVPPDDMTKLVVESKFYADFAYHQLLTGPVPMLDGWIEQTLIAADEGDFWIVCFKTNRKPWIAVFDAAHAESFTLGNHLYYTAKDGQKCVATGLNEFLAANATAIRGLCA